MIPFEGFAYWFLPEFKIAILFLIPTLVGLVGVITRKILCRYYNAKSSRIYKVITDISFYTKPENNWPELQRLQSDYKQAYSLSNRWKSKSIFNTLLLGSLEESVLAFLQSLVGWLLKIIAFFWLVDSILTPFPLKAQYNKAYNYYMNHEKIVMDALNNEHLTSTYIIKMEKYNEEVKGYRYLTEDFKNNPDNFIDTEQLWANFCNNIDLKRSTEIPKKASASFSM